MFRLKKVHEIYMVGVILTTLLALSACNTVNSRAFQSGQQVESDEVDGVEWWSMVIRDSYTGPPDAQACALWAENYWRETIGLLIGGIENLGADNASRMGSLETRDAVNQLGPGWMTTGATVNLNVEQQQADAQLACERRFG